jgi:poly(A) polymerase/tRNA nucleotidyltransferase (CCA-adding enzyme)
MPHLDLPDDPGLRAVLAALPEARLVGGSVRDMLAGRPIADIDLATPLPPERIMAALTAAGIAVIPTGLAHGTVTAVVGGNHYEVTTLRRDLATDGRHATVAFTDDWREDAARRDFTINAMSLSPTGMLHDYFGGESDLAAGIVRFVGDPATRLAEDYLRLLRFFRFHARYGRTAPDAAALAAIRAAIPGLARLSPERIWSELKRLLAAPAAAPTVALMECLGVLQAVLPEGFSVPSLAALEARGAPAEPLLRLAALLAGSAPALADRLRLSGAERQHLIALRTPPIPTDHDDDATLRRLLADTPRDILLGRAWLAGLGESARLRISTTPAPVFPLHGRDLVAIGMKSGPDMGVLLRELRDWWMAGGCVADREPCLAELRRRRAGGAP